MIHDGNDGDDDYYYYGDGRDEDAGRNNHDFLVDNGDNDINDYKDNDGNDDANMNLNLMITKMIMAIT